MLRRIRILVLLACVNLCAVAQDSPQLVRELPLNRFADSRLATAREFYRMPTAIGDDYFDGTDPLTRVRRHLSTARALGVKYLRCAFSWNGIEPQQGRYQWRFWDQLVQEAELYGVELIPYVAYTPEWAAAQEKEFWKQPPRDPKLYADFMRTIVRRYKGRIRSWEIWNEPDLRDYWQGSAQQFAEMVKMAAAEMRRADPAVVLVLGGVSRGPGDFFRELITRHHVDRWVDVVAMHAYPESWHEERVEIVFDDWLPAIQGLLRESRSGVDLWLNEMGYADYRYTPDKASVFGVNVYYQHEHTRNYAGVVMLRMHLLALASEAFSLVGWYRVDDFLRSEKRLGTDYVHFHLGVLDTNGRQKPTFRALRLYNQLLGKPVRVLREVTLKGNPKSQAIVTAFERRDNTIVVGAWLRSSEHDEVPRRTGTLRDTRLENLVVGLPCRSLTRLRAYSPNGQLVTPKARIRGAQLSNIRLTGDSIFLAEVKCVAPTNRRIDKAR